MTARRVLADFEGAWVFDRAVEHDGGDKARMAGRAVFTAVPGGLDYFETGEMRLNGGPPLTATRRYLWRAPLDVFFDDGRAFHAVPPEGGAARHWCAPDMYDVDYDFSGWPLWQTTWAVQGPKKNYRMVTRYSRQV